MGCGSSQNMVGNDQRLSKAEIEEAKAELMKTMERFKNATTFAAKELTPDFEFLYQRFVFTSLHTYNAVPEINLHGIKNGLVDLLFKMFKALCDEFYLKNTNFIWKRLRRVLVALWNGTDAHVEMCTRLLELKAQSYLLQVIQNPNIIEAAEEGSLKYTRQIYMINGVLGVTHNMLWHLGESARIAYRQIGAVGVFQKQLDHRDTKVKTKAFMNLAYLVDEDENELINADDVHIQYIVDQLEDAINSPHRKSRRGFAAMEAVEVLNKLAVNDKNKERILKIGTMKHYEKLLTDGVAEKEQIKIVHGIWTLAFNEQCRNAIKKKKSLHALLQEMSSSKNAELKRKADGALWVLEGDHAEKVFNDKDTENIYHIMISYNWDVKPTALRIRNQLLDAGFKVWMDVDDMTGSTLEAMAHAIEKAAVVIICMTRKYKESPSCRTEAEYTYQLRKPFIPLRLEAGYKADGWLGIMVGTKLWFDFIKDFKAAIAGLIKELGNRGKKGTNALEVGSTPKALTSTASSSTQSKYVAWSQVEVSTWLKENDLVEQASQLLLMDGSLLKELCNLRRDAPEFFFSNLKDDLQFRLIDILKFAKALDRLT